MRMKLRGVTLIMEAIAFIAVIAVVAAVALSNFSPTISEAKIQVALADINTIGGAVSHYHYDTKKYPSSLSVLTVTDSTTKKGPWLAALPHDGKDPWGNSYAYVYDSNGFIVYCTTNTLGNSVSIAISQANNLPANSIAFRGI